ncbi:MAG: hypothetical protein JSW55_14985 [Chloroflexota bacterium]|nr:MAG: hypothetical protein JSW55_14985 [Chloroflexota bacterium]
MKAIWSKYLLLIFVLAIALAGCGQEEPPTPTEQSAISPPTTVVEKTATNTPEPVEPTATDTQAPSTPTETLAPTATIEPTATEEVVVEETDACLACHSDKDQLIETAAPEEEVPSESSGVG